MNSKILHLTLSSLAILLWLFLYIKGIRKVPYIDDIERYKNIFQFLPLLVCVFIMSILYLFDDTIKRYFKTEPKEETKLMRIRTQWGLMTWVVNYVIAMMYILSTGRYYQIFDEMIFPIFLLFIGNFMPLIPFNNFDLFSTWETCSSQAIWRKVFRTRGMIFSISAIIMFIIIVLQPNDAMWSFYLIVSLVPILWIHTWAYSKYLYRKDIKNTIHK